MRPASAQMTVEEFINNLVAPDIFSKGYSLVAIPLCDGQNALYLHVTTLGKHPLDRFHPAAQQAAPEKDQ